MQLHLLKTVFLHLETSFIEIVIDYIISRGKDFFGGNKKILDSYETAY